MAQSILQIINQRLTPPTVSVELSTSIALSQDVAAYPRIDANTKRTTPLLVDQHLEPLRLGTTQFILGGFQGYRPGL